MDYSILINDAIKKDEVIKLLRGEKEYQIVVSEFSPDVFPTDITSVLVNCFYKQRGKMENIERIFDENIEKLLMGSASDIYVAVLYFDACIFQEEIGKATFQINKEKMAKSIKIAIEGKKEELQGNIIFQNGMNKQNPMKNIENFNKYYYKKYGFEII